MLTLDRKQQPPTLRERRAMRPLLLGGLLYLGLAVVPLSAAGPFSALRALGLCILLGAAALLIGLGLPRTREHPLPPRASRVPRVEERPVELELTSDALPPVYRAELVYADGTRRVLLERPEPAGVLADAVELARALEVPLSPGWGLDQHALDDLVAAGTAPEAYRFADTPLRLEWAAFAGQRNAAITTIWAAGFVLVATFVMSASARATVTPGALSIVLPCIGAILVLVVGLWIFGLRGEVVVTPTNVTTTRSWFARPLGKKENVATEIRAAAVVQPPGAIEGHVLLATARGYLAFPIRGTTPQALRQSAAHAAATQTRAAE
jgi:hypothetical protein